MTADNNGYTPNAFYVQKDIPVKWIIDGKQINSCNNSVVAQSLNVQKKIKSGENIIEFTPGDKDINFSCWMGMIRGVIKVVDDLNSVDPSKSDPSIPPASNGPSCCAVPVDEDSDETSAASIYGNDISLVPTETIINKSRIFNNEQIAQFKGIGYELQPLVIVTGNSGKTKLTFDLNAFDNAEGEYTIIDVSTWEEVTTFTAKQGLNDIVFSPKKSVDMLFLEMIVF